MALNIHSICLNNLAVDPASPVEGQLIYNTTSNCLKYYDGTDWLCLTESAVEQKGKAAAAAFTGTSTTDGTATASVVFATAFSTAPSNIQLTTCSTDACGAYVPTIIDGTITTTGFDIDLNSTDTSGLGATGGIAWRACL